MTRIVRSIKEDTGGAVITAIVLLAAAVMSLCVIFRHYNIGA